MDITFLGTGNAFGDGGRNPMAILITHGERGLLLDCGPATLPAMKALGLSPDVLDVVLLSHHHGDHYGGLPFILLDSHYRGRSKPLAIVGPPGTEQAVSSSLALFFPSLGEHPFPLRFVEDGKYSPPGDSLRVAPFEVDHYSRGTAFGYRLSIDGKTVVYSGDTAWTEELAEQSAGAELLICECSSFEESLPQHMSHRDLMNHRGRLKAKRTLLVHPGNDVLQHEQELAFELAHDGQRVTL